MTAKKSVKERFMALYRYEAFLKSGQKITGVLDAPSTAAVREHVLHRGGLPTIIQVVTDVRTSGFSFKQFFEKKVTTKDKIFFTKQLAVLLKAGVPIMQALELLIEQTDGSLRTIVIALKDGIKEGQSLGDGLNNYPKVFDTTYIQLVRAGEASGRLEIILERLTTFLEREHALRAKISSAITPAVIQLIIVGLVVVALLTVVVPQIADVFATQGVVLPGATRALLAFSAMFTEHGILLFIIISCLVAIFMWWKRTPWGALQYDRFLLKVPIVRYFVRMKAVIQFSRTLGMLTEGGVNLAQSLHIVCKIVDNRVLVSVLDEARERIIKQGRVAEYLKKTNMFPATAIYLINTGEQSGHLDTMLLTVADIYEGELNEFTDGLAAKLSPLTLVVMGAIVGFVVMAVGKPLISMDQLTESMGQEFK